MTSQVAILNSQGVALASDSAVTFFDDRVYNSVNKIFPLPNPHQIAFMFSETASCESNGMRWERVISQFVDATYSPNHQPAQLHSKYVDDFIAFMEDPSNGFDEEQNGLAVQRALMKWLRDFGPMKDTHSLVRAITRGTSFLDDSQDVNEGDEKPESLTDRMISKIMEESPNFLLQLHEDMKQAAPRYHVDQNVFATQLEDLKQFHSKALSVVSDYFCNHWILPDDGTEWGEIIGEICVMHMSFYPDPRQDFRNNRFPRDDDYPHDWGPWWFDFTTLAIVGFGSEDNAPGMVEFRIGPVIIPDVETNQRRLVGRARPHKEAVYNISKPDSVWYNGALSEEPDPDSPMSTILEAGAFIKPFAMSREIDNILNGIHNETLAENIRPIPDATQQKLGRWITERLDERDSNGKRLIGERTKKKVLTALEGTRDNDSLSHMDISRLLGDTIMGPVMRARVDRRQGFRRVAMGIPMKELAEFARTLIGIEAEICHWLRPIRSVGGVIDVATITKEDGFQWID